MSLIQPVLEQRHRDRPTAAVEQGSDQSLRTGALGCHAEWYRENLAHCNEPMLQYEWAWLQGRLDALRHCHRDGDDRCDALLAECQLFRTLLLQEFASRGLRPRAARACVIPSEEAWEITSQQVKEEWGIL